MPNKADKKHKALLILQRLKELYPNSECALEYGGDPWRLFVMARLSAQCTDARVNTVCRDLFKRYGNVYEMAEADISELEEAVRPCGLYKMKAAQLKAACQMLISRHGGNIPSDMSELLALPGVGRKIANLLRGDIFGLGGIVADTHCIRISGKLGLCREGEKDAVKVEKALEPLIPKEEQSDFCHRIINLGREICSARSPRCHECPLSDICDSYAETDAKQNSNNL
ncbi:MAG: endonuclease III [Clostridia bacterium]|nr:endonuclease III [Clostridia bacterium]